MSKIKLIKNGASVMFQRNDVSGFYTVTLYSPNFNIVDRVSCDTYRAACEYRRAFIQLAKNAF